MNNNPLIELELRKLGLTEKEVRVYLAGLDLGPNSVQNIARITKLARPTTYEIIKKLGEKGLFIESKDDKKRYFVAQSPENILGILRTKKREIEEKEREFVRIISGLESKYSKEKGEIKLYKGKGGLAALEEIISFSSIPDILIVNEKINPLDSSKLKELFQEIKKRLGKIKISKISLNKIPGSLIIFDKAIYFPKNKQEGVIIENEIIVELFKSIFQI